MSSQLLPLELIDRCVGSPIWVIMKGDKGSLLLSSPHRIGNGLRAPELTYKILQSSVAR